MKRKQLIKKILHEGLNLVKTTKQKLPITTLIDGSWVIDGQEHNIFDEHIMDYESVYNNWGLNGWQELPIKYENSKGQIIDGKLGDLEEINFIYEDQVYFAMPDDDIFAINSVDAYVSITIRNNDTNRIVNSQDVVDFETLVPVWLEHNDELDVKGININGEQEDEISIDDQSNTIFLLGNRFVQWAGDVFVDVNVDPL